jgi:hypothetical protein
MSQSLTKSTAVAKSTGTFISSSIVTGGTVQVPLVGNPARNYLFFQNTSSADLYINMFGGSASPTNGILVPSKQSYENPAHFCPTGGLTVFGATSGQSFIIVHA